MARRARHERHPPAAARADKCSDVRGSHGVTRTAIEKAHHRERTARKVGWEGVVATHSVCCVAVCVTIREQRESKYEMTRKVNRAYLRATTYCDENTLRAGSHGECQGEQFFWPQRWCQVCRVRVSPHSSRLMFLPNRPVPIRAKQCAGDQQRPHRFSWRVEVRLAEGVRRALYGSEAHHRGSISDPTACPEWS